MSMQFDGYLFSKLDRIRSKSEGPEYFLQQFDYQEYPVIKKAHPWLKDETLHPFLNKKVTIEGDMAISGIVYESVRDYKPRRSRDENPLTVALELESDVLWVNKMPPGPNPSQSFELTLVVNWPYRGTWQGRCPTSQLYDFWINCEGETIWRWSDGKVFLPVVTPINLLGGRDHRFTEVWSFKPESIELEGSYTAGALFIASGQEVTKDFTVKFAHKRAAAAVAV